jgi:hypothetical protein
MQFTSNTDVVVSEDIPSKDKAYRRYASGVERSLSLFDSSLQEWADYIQSLGRLLKVRSLQPLRYTYTEILLLDAPSPSSEHQCGAFQEHCRKTTGAMPKSHITLRGSPKGSGSLQLHILNDRKR